MPFQSYLLASSDFQAASHTLPPSEQIQLGGMSSVRGYPEGDYLADIGATLNLDWVFPMYLFPKSWILPRTKTPLRSMIEPVAFFDMGGGELYAVGEGENGRKFLAGIGGGGSISRAIISYVWNGPKPSAINRQAATAPILLPW